MITEWNAAPVDCQEENAATASDALFQRPTKDRGEVTIFALQQKAIQGAFKASFAATVRSMFAGKTPKLKNVYPAMTRTGLPALYVRDGSQVMVRGRSKSMVLCALA